MSNSLIQQYDWVNIISKNRIGKIPINLLRIKMQVENLPHMGQLCNLHFCLCKLLLDPKPWLVVDKINHDYYWSFLKNALENITIKCVEPEVTSTHFWKHSRAFDLLPSLTYSMAWTLYLSRFLFKKNFTIIWHWKI